MPKKTMTEAERKAFGEKMRLAREAKANLVAEEFANTTPEDIEAAALLVEELESQDEPEPAAPTGLNVTTIDSDDLASLMTRLKLLESAVASETGNKANVAQYLQGQAQVASDGSLIGYREKYIMDPAHYPNPVDRLREEKMLRRFAFDINYDLYFNVSVSSYKTIEGVNTREPKFTLELVQVMIDEDTGLPTNGRIVRARLIFHEDPEAALVIAQEQGLEVDQQNEARFLNEMRYLRMQDWLIGCFYPPRINKHQERRDMVVGGQVVEFFEVNSPDAVGKLPFDQLDSQKKLRPIKFS